MGESSHWLGAPCKNAMGSVGSSSVGWTKGGGAAVLSGSAVKAAAGISSKTVPSAACAGGDPSESSRKVAKVGTVEESISTSGNIEATAASVSAFETIGGTDNCGATTARGIG